MNFYQKFSSFCLLLVFSSKSLFCALCDPFGYAVGNPNFLLPFNMLNNTSLPIMQYSGMSFSSIAISADGTKGYITGADPAGTGVIYTFDTATGAQIGSPITVGSGNNPLGSIVLTSDGSKAFVCDPNSQSIVVLDLLTNTPTSVPIGTANPNPSGLAISPDGTKLYVASSSDNTIYVFMITSSSLTPLTSFVIPTTSFIQSITVAPDGMTAYVTADTELYPVNLSTNTPLAPISLPLLSSAYDVIVSSDGKSVFVSGRDGVCKIQSNMVVGVFSKPVLFSGLTLSLDGTKLYAADLSDGIIFVFDALSSSPMLPEITKMNFLIPGNMPASPLGIALVPCTVLEISANSCQDIWQTDLYNFISWPVPTKFTPTSYLIYRDGVLIATVPLEKTFFVDHNVIPNQTYTYTIAAQTANGIIKIGKGVITR